MLEWGSGFAWASKSLIHLCRRRWTSNCLLRLWCRCRWVSRVIDGGKKLKVGELLAGRRVSNMFGIALDGRGGQLEGFEPLSSSCVPKRLGEALESFWCMWNW
jgi:hypothetical protein